jgi:hypothetical protein
MTTVIRHCPCGNVSTPDVPCAGFPGVWNEERGDFERGACLGEEAEYVPAEQLRGAVEALEWIAHQTGTATCDDSVRVMNDAYEAATAALDRLGGQS